MVVNDKIVSSDLKFIESEKRGKIYTKAPVNQLAGLRTQPFSTQNKATVRQHPLYSDSCLPIHSA
jgi:hypothetical protein